MALAILIDSGTSAQAQPSKKKGGGGPAGPAGPMGPPAGMSGSGNQYGGKMPGGPMGPSGGMGGPMGPMGPMGPAGKKAGVKKPAAKREAPETIDNESLPPGYTVPQEPPESLTTTAEWIEDPFQDKGDKKTNQKSMLQRYRKILEDGDFKEGDKAFVTDIMKWKLSKLTHKDIRDTAEDWREKQIKKDLALYPQKGNPKTVRKHLLKVVADEAPRLFEYHAMARLNGAILLSELCEINETDAEGKNPAVPCFRGADPLMEVVKDTKQLTAVRGWGVKGLVRLATLPEMPSQKRSQIVDTLVAQMNASGKEYKWYQFRLAEGLGKLNVVQNQDKRPFVPQALARVLTDTERPWLVRAEAAQSLGRLPYDSNLDVGLLAYEIARLAQQMTEAYNKQPSLAIWKLCFMKLYGAFKPLEEEESKQKRGLLSQVESRPVLSTYKKTVQESFDVVLPLVVKVVGDEKEKDVDGPLSSLKKWLEQNPPKNTRIHESEDPIISKPNTANRIPDGETAPVSAQQPVGAR